MPQPANLPAPPNTKLAARPEHLDGPPEEEFWDKYNKRLEFPLSAVSAVLVHVLVGALLIYVLFTLMANKNDRSGVPVKLVDLAGLDEAGMGSAGSGGEDDPFVVRDGDQRKSDITSFINPSDLPKVREDIQQAIKYFDKEGRLPISDSNVAAYAALNEKVRDKLLGGKQGSGPGDGAGYDGSAGKGPGGKGADSTLGRNMRWVLRFKVSGGRDYLAQLKTMKAKILVPMPGSDKCLLIENLDNPTVHRLATDADLGALANQIKFSDHRRDAVQGVAGALGLDFRPDAFWAFFPKEIEEDLSNKETGFRNRRSDDIEETIFRVSVIGGQYKIVVDEQKIKR